MSTEEIRASHDVHRAERERAMREQDERVPDSACVIDATDHDAGAQPYCKECGGHDIALVSPPACIACDSDEHVVIPPPPASFFTAAVYRVDRAYGGPEEGGWWYDCRQLETRPDGKEIPIPQTFTDKAEALKGAEAMQATLNGDINKGRPEVGWSNSRGVYCAVVCDGFPAPYWPTERPHYE